LEKKTARLKDKVTIAQEETMSNIRNGTMFGDLDWPLNVSRGFVSISWASWQISFTIGLSNLKRIVKLPHESNVRKLRTMGNKCLV